MKRYLLSGLCLVLFGCQEPGSGEAPPTATPAAAATSNAPAAAPPTVAPAQAPVVAEAPSAKAKFTAPTTPEAIQVPAGAQPLFRVHAKGVQIYACSPKKDAPQVLEWTLKGPEAELLNDQGVLVGKHIAGPTWQAVDDSKIVGVLKAKVDAPTPDAIPWLLLEAKSEDKLGVFSKVSFVQRVDTEGGKAPAKGCDKAHLNAEVRVDYQANYYFYTP